MFRIFPAVLPRVQPEEAEREIREAIEFHLEGLREDGAPIPPPSSAVRYVDIAA